MSALLYAFGIGLALALGVVAGCVLAACLVRRVSAKQTTDTIALNNRIEDRLAKYVEHTERIATAMEFLGQPAKNEAELRKLFIETNELLGAIAAELGVHADMPIEEIIATIKRLKAAANLAPNGGVV